MKKRLIGAAMAAIMCLIVAIPAYATNDPQNVNSGSKVMDITSQGYRIVQNNEAVSLLMEKKGYSYADALQVVDDAVTRGVTLGERWIKYPAGMGYEIEVGCLIEVE